MSAHLVVGATGRVGTEICRLLSAAGKPVKAFVRKWARASVSAAAVV